MTIPGRAVVVEYLPLYKEQGNRGTGERGNGKGPRELNVQIFT